MEDLKLCKPSERLSQFQNYHQIQAQLTLVISNSKELTETLRDIRTSTYQSWESEENNKLNNHI